MKKNFFDNIKTDNIRVPRGYEKCVFERIMKKSGLFCDYCPNYDLNKNLILNYSKCFNLNLWIYSSNNDLEKLYDAKKKLKNKIS